MEATFENFQQSFDPLNHQLLENAMQELYSVSKSAILSMMKKKKFKRLESHLNVLQNYILHLHIKNSTSHENEDAVVCIEYRDLFLRLLSCLMDAYLLASIKNETYVQRAVQDLRLYTGNKIPDICAVLLECGVIKKAYSAFCQPLLKYMLSVIPDDSLSPKEYMRYLLLLRIWKMFTDNSIVKASIIDLASKLKAASGLKEFLSIFKQDGQSLLVLSGSNRKFARHFMCKKFPPGFLKNMRQMLCEDSVSVATRSPAAKKPLCHDNIENACFSEDTKRNTNNSEDEIQSSIIFCTQTFSSITDGNDAKLPTSSQKTTKNETDQFSSFFIDKDGGSLTPKVNKSVQRKISYLRNNSHVPESEDGDDNMIETASPIVLSSSDKNSGPKDLCHEGNSRPESVKKKRIKKNQCKIEANQLGVSPQNSSKCQTAVISSNEIGSCELISKNDDIEPDYGKAPISSSDDENECENTRQKKKSLASSSKSETIKRNLRKRCIASSDISKHMAENCKKKQHVSLRTDEDPVKENPGKKYVSNDIGVQIKKHIICAKSVESSKKASVNSGLTTLGTEPLICDNDINDHEDDSIKDDGLEIILHTSDENKSSSNSLEKSLLEEMRDTCNLKKSLVDNGCIAKTDDSDCSDSLKTSHTSDEINIISNSPEKAFSETTKEMNFSDHGDGKEKRVASNEIICPSKYLSTCSKNSLGKVETSDCLSNEILIISNPSDEELTAKLKVAHNRDVNKGLKKTKKKEMEVSVSNMSANNSINALIFEEIDSKNKENCSDNLEKTAIMSEKKSPIVSNLAEKSHSVTSRVVNNSNYGESNQNIQNSTFIKPVSGVPLGDSQDVSICIVKDSESNTGNKLNGTSHRLDEINDISGSLQGISPCKSKITNYSHSGDGKKTKEKKSTDVLIKKRVKSSRIAQLFSDSDSESEDANISKHLKTSHTSDEINIISYSSEKESSSESRKGNYFDKNAEERAEGKRSANTTLNKSMKSVKKMRICSEDDSESDIGDDVGKHIKSSCTSDEINVIPDSPEREAFCKSTEVNVSNNDGKIVKETKSENSTLRKPIKSSKIIQIISENNSESNDDNDSKLAKTSHTSDEINIISDSPGKESPSNLAKVKNTSYINTVSPRILSKEKSNVNASDHIKENSPSISNTNAQKIDELGVNSDLKKVFQQNKLTTESTNIRPVIRDLHINVRDCLKTSRLPKRKDESSSTIKEQTKSKSCLFENGVIEDKTKENDNGDQNSPVISNSKSFHIKLPGSDIKFSLLSDSCRNKNISKNVSMRYSTTGPLRQSTRIKERSTPWKCMGPDFSDLGKSDSRVSKVSLINIISPNSKTHRTSQNNDSLIIDDETFHSPSTSDCETDAFSVTSENAEVEFSTIQRQKQKAASGLLSNPEAKIKLLTDDCSNVGFSLKNMILDSDVGKVRDMLPSDTCDCRKASIGRTDLRRSTRTRKGSSSSVNSLTQNSSDDEGGSQKLMQKIPALPSLHEILEISPAKEKSESNLKIKETSNLPASTRGIPKGYNLRTRKQLVKPAKFL